MDSSSSATASQKTGIANPFDQIATLEAQEKERIEKELSAMRSEREQVSQAVAIKEDQETEDMRTKAKKELKADSESELSPILNNAAKEAEAEAAKLEKQYVEQEKTAVAEVIAAAKNPDSYLTVVA